MIKILPHISEKTVSLAKQGFFTLEVSEGVTKKSLISSIKENFKLNPVSVNIMNGKTIVSRRGKKDFSDRGYKKAIVKLSAKEVMPGYEAFLVEAKKEEKKAKAGQADKKIEKKNG